MGGAKEFKVIEVANVNSITVTAGVVTTVDNATAKRWWSYKVAKDTAYGKATPTINEQNGSKFYAQEVGFALNKMQTNTSLELDKMAQNTIYIALADRNGKYWLYGHEGGMTVTGGESGTGTAAGDRNGYSLVFSGQEPLYPLEIDADTWASLETPGS